MTNKQELFADLETNAGADDIKDWFMRDKPDDWRQRD